MTFFRDNIDAMTSYIPGEQPAGGERVVKLNQNENPYPPSPAALEVLRQFDGGALRLYPDPMAREFCRTAGDVLGVPPESILVGDGSDDIIIMIARACLAKGRTVVYPVPTFPFYFTQAQVEDAQVVAVPFNDDFSLPIDALAQAGGAVTFVANPGSPTGVAPSTNQLDYLAGKLDGLLVIDEAYVDFAEENALVLAGKHANVIVLRTLSKGYSLAGLRLGFGITDPGLLAGLLKTKAIYNVGALPAAVGAAAIADQDYHNQCVAKIVASRARLTADLAKLGFTVVPSQANFLLARPPAGDAERIYESLKARGILVRYFYQPPLDDKLRITVGTDEQNAVLVEALVELRTGIGS